MSTFDNTVYQIQRQLWSDPVQGIITRVVKPSVRAIGQPGADAVEIFVIDDTFVQSVRSTGAYFVISRLKRIK